MNRKELIARACHEANRSICEGQGDFSQVPWEEAPQNIKDSAIDGVEAALSGMTPHQLHENWCEFKRKDGWVWGEEKDAEKKTHPCLVYYYQLTGEQRVKDHVFRSVVDALSLAIREE